MHTHMYTHMYTHHAHTPLTTFSKGTLVYTWQQFIIGLEYMHLHVYIFVSEFEKRGNFVQYAIFCHFSTSHHFKPVRALGFRLS